MIPLPNHHPSDALLMSQAFGALAPGLALAVSVHLDHCPLCVERLAVMEALGGLMVEDEPPHSLNAGALEHVLDRLDGLPPEVAPVRPVITATARLRAQAGQSWRFLAPGIRQQGVELVNETGRSRTRLLRIAPGTPLPHHGHGGLELTVVLEGSFSDEIGRFRAGDLAELDPSVDHQPLADGREDCVCLIATTAPLRFTGLMPRLMQPLIGL